MITSLISSLEVRDFVLIERLALDLGAGLNALTGGSGEGKTLVVRALRFLFGLPPDDRATGRAAASRIVRPGAREAVVEARLPAVDPAAREALRAAGVGADLDGPLVVGRAIDRSGRGRAWLRRADDGDGVASGELPPAALRALGERLVEVFGQGEAAQLAEEARQRAALDLVAGCAAEARAYAAGREQALELARQRDLLEAEEARLRDEGARWREERDALAALDPRPGEYAELVAGAERLAAREADRAALAEVLGLLADDDGGLLERGRQALGRLDRLQQAELLEPARRAVEEALALVGEAAGAVRRAGEAEDDDPEAVERLRERLASHRQLARRLRTAPEALATRWAELETIAEPDDLAARRGEVEARLRPLLRDLQARALALTAAREAAAPRLQSAVQATLPRLGLDGATFEVSVAGAAGAPLDASSQPLAAPDVLRRHPSPHGRDVVAFRFAGGAGQAPAPLDRASGGELARLFLALGLETAATEQVPLLVFDEVDQNIGARLGSAIGACLAGIARGRQVLAVTHLATVAAHADRHLRVVKTGGVTAAEAIDGEARVEELALMIKGAPVTAAARAQARELLAEAAASAASPAPAGPPDGAAPRRRAGRSRPRRSAVTS